MAATVSQLWVYPVKSLKGIRLEAARVTARGLAHDRRFVVVDPEGCFLTQREHPAMATVWTEIDGGELRLSAPEFDEVKVPLEPVSGDPLQAEVWSSVTPAIAPSPKADRWLSAVLGRACRLASRPESPRRAADAPLVHVGVAKGVGGGGHAVPRGSVRQSCGFESVF